ncbi:hypothetical protein JCM6882_000582 [Rhodosporidiobolus microsporus]
MVTVTIDLDAGTAEPTDAPRRSGRVRTRTFEPKPPSSPLDPHPLFDHPDLLPHLLVSPILEEEDLLALALVNRRLRGAVRDQLFRSISLLSPDRALGFSTLLIEDPTLLHHVRAATVALADLRASWVEAGRTIDPVEKEEEVSLWEGTGATWTFNINKASAKAKAIGEVWSQSIMRWPFVEGRDAAFPDLLFFVFHSVTTLTIASPLSHYLEPLIPMLSKSTSITELRLFGDARGTAPKIGAASMALPIATAVVRPGHRGLLGGASTVRDLEVKDMVVTLPDYDEVDSARKPWTLTALALQDVTVTHPPASPPDAHSPVIYVHDFSLGATFTPESSSIGPSQENIAQLDLSRLCGGDGPSRLTTLTLRDVDGLSPSSVNLIIRESGPVLRHLSLHNLGVGSSAYHPLTYSDSDKSIEREPEPVLRHTFAGAGVQPRADFLRSLQNLAATASRFPPSDESTTSAAVSLPSPSLADALSTCKHLSTLRLTASANPTFATSLFPPSLLDTLLSTAPPLRIFEWDVAVDGPTPVDGWLSAADWRVFAEGVDEMRGWTILEECRVAAKLWEWEEATEEEA